MSLDEWREVLSVMLDGAFVATQAVIPAMLERGWGRFINIIGITGQAGAPQRAHVVAGKSGLIGFTKALALEYAGRGITVNAISPGFIDTARGGTSSVVQPAHRADRRVPMGHLGEPDDVASLCSYLASEDGRFITSRCWRSTAARMSSSHQLTFQVNGRRGPPWPASGNPAG